MKGLIPYFLAGWIIGLLTMPNIGTENKNTVKAIRDTIPTIDTLGTIIICDTCFSIGEFKYLRSCTVFSDSLGYEVFSYCTTPEGNTEMTVTDSLKAIKELYNTVVRNQESLQEAWNQYFELYNQCRQSSNLFIQTKFEGCVDH